MSYFNRILSLSFALVTVLWASSLVMAQSPPVPDKSPLPGIPGKSTPLALPQGTLASPQAAYDPVPVAPLVLRAPVVYQVQRQVLVQAAPVVAYTSVAYDPGCVAQQQVVVQRNVIQHSAVIQRGIIQRAAVVHEPRRVVTKSRSRTVTKTRRGLFGRG